MYEEGERNRPGDYMCMGRERETDQVTTCVCMGRERENLQLESAQQYSCLPKINN